MNYLKQAVDNLRIYTTPKKVQQYVNKHKFDFLIQNPPYNIRKRNKNERRKLKKNANNTTIKKDSL